VTSAYGLCPANLSNDRPRYAGARVAECRRRGSYRVGKSPPPRAIHPIGPWRSGMLVVRLTALIVCLHKLEILLWALFIACIAFQPGNLLSTFPQRVILLSTMEIFFSQGRGASRVRKNALQVC
jgi:hypothetical protein